MLVLNKALRLFVLISALCLPFFKSYASAPISCSSLFLFEIPLQSTYVMDEHAYGQILRYTAHPSLTGPLKDTLRIGTYNVLNLYEHTPRADKYYPLEKDHARRLGNAKAIHDIDPDFQILVEVENLQAAIAFNKEYLGNRYKALLLEGNDSAGINIALLVRQNLPVEIEWRSYRHFRANIFSRDLPVALVYERDSQGRVTSQPKFALLATHYKSKRTERGQEDLSADKRRLQVRATLDIVKRLQKEFGNAMPIILAGDFNSNLHTSKEFSGLFKKGFQDSLDLLDVDPADRATHYYFSSNARYHEASQLDAILVLSDNAKVISGRVIPDRNDRGEVLDAPKTYEERQGRPSDHRALGIEIKLR